MRIRLITISPQIEEEFPLSLFDKDFDEDILDCAEFDDTVSRQPYDPEDAVIMKMEEDECASVPAGDCELETTARYYEDGSLVYFSYDESELTGMEGAKTSVIFDKNKPSVVSILRSGTVKSSLVLEEGVRHTSAYTTQYLPFEICVYAKKVENSVVLPSDGVSLPKGEIYLDYIVELKGMNSQRTRILIKIG